MAHECPECSRVCHCGGDIDDIHWGENVDCKCQFSDWGCGNDSNWQDDEWWDEDE